MRLDFGAMPLRAKARSLAHSTDGFLEYVYYSATNRLLRGDPQQYPARMLMVLVSHTKDTEKEIDRVVQMEAAGQPVRFEWVAQAPGAGVDPGVPMATGDKVADEWERAIAAGQIPDDWIVKED